MADAEGQEVLVVDGDASIQRGMRSLLTELGAVPTVVGDMQHAQPLVREKYFAVAILGLDTLPDGGLELLRWMRKEAPGTTVIALTARKAFEAAVEAFRAGASDVIFKAPTEIDYLRRRIVEACAQVRNTATNDRLLHDVLALHEDFLKRLMEISRRAAELEERLGGGAQSSDADEATSVLIVESHEDHWLSDELHKSLEQRPGYRLYRATTGGEALDVVGAQRFHIALVSVSLPDLPGSMVVNTLRAQSPEMITILFSRPGKGPGQANVIEGSRMIPLLAEFSSASQMSERLDELRLAFVAKSRERRYLAAFRQQNYELLKRFADLKQKLKRAT